MASTQFTLSWESYQRNICSGLGSLQQNGEFVDMTLAADGHHVKVHQFIISLISPYLKDIIKSLDCKHPVIFLNKISHKTLSSILEYVYTGQVIVAQDDIDSLIEAGKALKIKGLEDMTVRKSLQAYNSHSHSLMTTNQDNDTLNYSDQDDLYEDTNNDNVIEMEPSDNHNSMNIEDTRTNITGQTHKTNKEKSPQYNENMLQYTVSNQGSLQLILNRFIYWLRYNGKNNSGHRLWRCADYTRKRCPASVITKNNIVVQRVSAHTHPFHDKKIMKKLRDRGVFSAIPEAEQEGENVKKNKVSNTEMSDKDHDLESTST